MLLVLLVLTAGAFVLYRQWTAEPTHWVQQQRFLQDTPRAQLDDLAKQVEMRLPTEYTRRIEPGTDGLRTLDASFEEINAWLGVRLEKYLANQGVTLPDGVGAILVAPRDGQIVVAADVDLPQLRQIVSVYFEVLPPEELDPASKDRPADQAETAPWSVRVSRMTAGNVPLPAGRLVQLIRDELDEETLSRESVREVLDAVSEGRPIPLPRLKVDEVRRAEVRDFALDDAGVRATIRVSREDDQTR